MDTIFYDALFDENAASHLAFGNAFPDGATDPADRERNCKEGQEDKNAIAELFPRLVLRDQREDRGNEQGKEEQCCEVRKDHGFRPCAISNASSTMR